jgi:sugar phosphate permease
MLLADVVAALPAVDPHPILAASITDITNKFRNIGRVVVGVTVILALIGAFVTTANRRWVVVGGILLIGGFVFMIVNDPQTLLGELGGAIKSAVWDPLMSGLTQN